MDEFIDIHFERDNNLLKLQTHVPTLLRSPENTILHSNLTACHIEIQRKRGKFVESLRKLDVMEKHLIWAMYLNWREDFLTEDA